MLFFSLFVLVCGYYYQPNDAGGYSLGVGGSPIGLNNSVECGLYNPAAFGGSEKLNVFTGYKLTKGEMSSSGWPEDTFSLDYAFPDYLGVALPFGKDFFLGISLSVPYMAAQQYSLDVTVVDSSAPEGFRELSAEISNEIRFHSLNPSIGKNINDRFSVGLNMALFWMRSSSSDEATDPDYSGSSYTLDKYGIEPCLGLQYKANEILSFGFLIKKGFGKAYKENFNGSVSSVESDEGLPLVLAFGSGINLHDKIYLNISGEYMRWTLAYSGEDWDSDDFRNTIRLHLGGQYWFNDCLSFSAGFYTEPYPTKRVTFSSFDEGSYDQMFITGGLGLDFEKVTLAFSIASSALVKMDPALREETNFILSISYR
jgi:long-subunit fatty acid transport protein